MALECGIHDFRMRILGSKALYSNAMNTIFVSFSHILMSSFPIFHVVFPVFHVAFPYFSCYLFLFFPYIYLLIFYPIAQNVNILTNEIHARISVRKYAILADFAIV